MGRNCAFVCARPRLPDYVHTYIYTYIVWLTVQNALIARRELAYCLNKMPSKTGGRMPIISLVASLPIGSWIVNLCLWYRMSLSEQRWLSIMSLLVLSFTCVTRVNSQLSIRAQRIHTSDPNEPAVASVDLPLLPCIRVSGLITVTRGLSV